jgi:hypothetical protein
MSIFPASFTLSATDGRALGRHSATSAEVANRSIAASRRHDASVRVEYDLSDSQRVTLMREVYSAVAAGVESFENDDVVGPDLAHLLGSLLNDTYCEWPEERPLIGILRANFPKGHPVFSFVQIDNEEP